MSAHDEGAARLDLIAHLREQIARDPERYANDAKLLASVERLLQRLRETPREVQP